MPSATAAREMARVTFEETDACMDNLLPRAGLPILVLVNKIARGGSVLEVTI